MTLERWIVFWILTSSEAFQLKGPDGPMVVQLGGSVLLPCSVKTPLPLEELEVEWRRHSDELVHLFQEGEERPESQSYQYSGRAHFLTDGVTTGNYSLLLTNVTRADVGVYICKVFTDLNSDEITAEIRYIERLLITGARATAAYVGDEVMLNCSVDSHIPPGELEEVAWKRKDSAISVLVFKFGQNVSASTHNLYQDRVNFFSEEIPKGNYSLRLKHVRPEDKGEYVCKTHSGHLSANTTILLLGLGPPPVLILALILCVIALLLAVGLGIPSFIQLMKNVMPKRYPGYKGKMVVLPMNLKELSETIVSVTWKRTDQVILTFPDGEVLPDSSQRNYNGRSEFAQPLSRIQKLKNVSLRLKNVRMEDEGEYICEVRTSEKSENNCVSLQVYNWRTMVMHYLLVFFPNTVIFIAFILYGVKQGFIGEIITCATVNLVRFLLVFKTAPYLDLLPVYPKALLKSLSVWLQYIVVAGVLFSGVFANISAIGTGISTYFLGLAIGINLFNSVVNMFSALSALFITWLHSISYLGRYCFAFVDIINWTLLWLIVVGYSTFNLSMFIITSAVTLVVDLLFNFQQSYRYKDWYAISTVLLTVLYPACIITFLCYLYWILANKPEGPGLMCGSALLYILTAVSGFDHPDTTADIPIPHILVYIFGAAALPVLNATALATDLVMKMVTGTRLFSDLQVVVLPCECLFVSAWLALQLYHYWIQKRKRIKDQLGAMSKKIRCKGTAEDPRTSGR